MILMGALTFSMICRKINALIIHYIFSFILFSLSTLFLILTAIKDPGIMLASPIDNNDQILEEIPYCDVCGIYQLPKTIHCESCDCCIEELDHHCPWIGKCVGKKNKTYFSIFMLSWIIYLVYFMVMASFTIM